ncbi:hypothetical protein RRG08_060351 [Elysia crispata]|uniref:Uncharacterized protein n=1 Tax=Elysia crispata TaxID=231223 RepID=A0AAE1DFM7_9GAST|nr:hypothetical protein RRG08_060351 [Elysia crispata]
MLTRSAAEAHPAVRCWLRYGVETLDTGARTIDGNDVKNKQTLHRYKGGEIKVPLILTQSSPLPEGTAFHTGSELVISVEPDGGWRDRALVLGPVESFMLLVLAPLSELDISVEPDGGWRDRAPVLGPVESFMLRV